MERKNVRYNEIFSVDRGILRYCSVDFTGLTEKELNLLCLSNFGTFYLSPIITVLIDFDEMTISEMNLEVIGSVIDKSFSDKWRKEYDLLNLQYDLSCNRQVNEILDSSDENAIEYIDDSLNYDITPIHDRDKTRKAEFVDAKDGFVITSSELLLTTNDKKDTRDYTTHNQKHNQQHTYKKTLVETNGTLDVQLALKNELELLRNILIETIITDVKKFSTLLIY